MRLLNAENKVISFFKESAESKEIRIKFNKQLQDINDSITWLQKEFDDYEKEEKMRLSKTCKTARSIWKSKLNN